jgi:hypothetical protein
MEQRNIIVLSEVEASLFRKRAFISEKSVEITKEFLNPDTGEWELAVSFLIETADILKVVNYIKTGNIFEI